MGWQQSLVGMNMDEQEWCSSHLYASYKEPGPAVLVRKDVVQYPSTPSFLVRMFLFFIASPKNSQGSDS